MLHQKAQKNWDLLSRLKEIIWIFIVKSLCPAFARLRPICYLWLLERETLKDDPDTYLAYTEQEIRYFAGTYDEPGGVLTFNDFKRRRAGSL